MDVGVYNKKDEDEGYEIPMHSRGVLGCSPAQLM